MKSKNFLFSVVMAIYNTEEFLEEAIESVVKQTIGFEDNIQLILINDGSTDNSESICLKYQTKYPKNIVYKYKKNGGASSARNEGRKYVEGKYFNYLDSDDKWDVDAFRKVYDFFEAHYDEIDIVNARTVIFGGNNYTHPLDFKFKKGNRIINLEEEYESIQLGNAACFFKTSALKDVFQSTKLITAEDMLFMGQAVMPTLKYGVMPKVYYYYRRLSDGGSLSSKALSKKEWYTDIIKNCHKVLVDESIKKYGFVQRFVQYTILYEIQWRIYKNVIIDEVLNEKEKKEYRKSISDILKYVDDEIIMTFNNRKLMFKLYLLSLKYDKSIYKELKVKKDNYLYYKDIKLLNLHDRSILPIVIMEKKDNDFIIKGSCDLIANLVKEGNYKFNLVDSANNSYDVLFKKREYKVVKSFCDDDIISGMIFSIKIPIKTTKSFRFELKTKKGDSVYLRPSFGRHAGLATQLRNKTYRIIDDYLITYNSGQIIISKNSFTSHLVCEIKLLIKTLLKKQPKIVLDRIIYYLIKPFYRKPIWLIKDKYEKAGDNGESVFKYLSTWEDKHKYNIYFVLNKNSKDYKRLKKYGKIVNPKSFKYRFLFLHSSKIIDSVVVYTSINPFGRKVGYYKDLFKFDFVGLFHGIGQRDMSEWTNDYNFNIKLYVSGAEREYKAMIHEDNGYDESIIKLTGLPRFDELEKNDDKFIAFMPTWRNNLVGPVVNGANEREYVSDFKETDYCKFYNSLINDKRLLEKMKELGYTGVFYNHPNFMQQADDFEGNDIIKVSVENANPNEVISNCSLLVTDYSSAAFECTYLDKPVVYTQFDYESFGNNHTGTKGYFNYDKDSFGPVCHNLDSSVNEIIKYLEKKCKNDSKYSKRANKFFLYRDKNNSKRLVEEIVKYDSTK